MTPINNSIVDSILLSDKFLLPQGNKDWVAVSKSTPGGLGNIDYARMPEVAKIRLQNLIIAEIKHKI